MAQSHGSSLWREAAGSGAVPSATHMVFQAIGGKWQLVAATTPQARLLDLRGAGKFELVDVRTEYVLAASGAKVTPTAGGAETAVMTKPASKYVAAAVGAGTKVAQFFLDAVRGKLRLVPVTAPEALLVQVSGKVRCY